MSTRKHFIGAALISVICIGCLKATPGIAHDISSFRKIPVVLGGSVQHENWNNTTANYWIRATTSDVAAACWNDPTACAPVGEDGAVEADVSPDLTLTCRWNSGYSRTYHLTGFGNSVTTAPESGDFICTVTGTLTNHRSSPITSYFGVYAWANEKQQYLRPFVSQVTLPAMSSCQVTVSNVDFGTLSAGQKSVPSEITITKTGSGNSTITFTGSDLKSDGDLQLGQSSTIWVRPDDDSFIDAATGHWISGAAVNTIPLTATVGSVTPGGKYTSNLTATLTCE